MKAAKIRQVIGSAALAGLLACPAVTRANTTYIWSGGNSGTGYFDVGANWAGAAPPTSGPSDLIFGSVNLHSPNQPYTEFNYNLSSITFNSSALSYAIGTSNNNTIAVGAGGIIDSAASAESFSLGLNLNTSQIWNVGNSSGSLTLNGSLTFTSASTLTKTGAGTLNLALLSGSGTSAMSLQQGTTQISSGTLGLTGTTGSAVNLTGGAVLNVSGGAVVTANTAGSISMIVDQASSATVSGIGSQINAPSGNAEIDIGRSTSGTLTVANSGLVTSGNYLVVGGFNSGNSGTLNISSGGTVTAPLPLIGFKPGSTGTVLVTGSGSTLNATTNLEMSGNTIGGTYGGTSTLTITNSGVVNAAVTTFYSNNSLINASGGSLNTAGLNSNASGNGALILNDLSAGYALNLNGTSGNYTYSGSISGGGSINKSGGSVQTLGGSISGSPSMLVTNGTMNFALSGTNTIATLQARGSTVQVSSGTLSAANSTTYGVNMISSSALNISGGAIVNASSTSTDDVVVDSGSSILVTNAGSQLNLPLANNRMEIGLTGVGGLTVSNGASVTCLQPVLGRNTGSNGSLTVTGAGSTFNATGLMVVSGFNGTTGGNATVLVNNNGVLNAKALEFYFSSGSITVNGGTLNTGSLASWSNGYGSLALTDPSGGYALNINGSSGTQTYSGPITGTGTLNKTGGSTQILSGTLACGAVIANGGLLQLSLASSPSNAIDHLSVTGGTAQMSSGALSAASNNSFGLFVSSGTFNLSGGAKLTSFTTGGFISTLLETNGSALVTGSGTQLSSPNTGFLGQIDAGGFTGNGTLSVTNSGNVSSGNLVLVGGVQSGASGTLLISSSGSVTAPFPDFGYAAGTTGTGTVTGAGSILNATSNLELGGDSSGASYGGTGILTISNGGTVNAAATTFYSNTSSINISGGTLITGGLNSNASGNGAILLTDPSGGTALTLNGSSGSYIYSGTFAGTGTLLKTGGSTQTLSGGGTLGGLSLQGGLTQLTSGTLSALTSGLSVASGATLNISGGAILNAGSAAIDVTLAGGSAVNVTGAGSQLNAPLSGGQINVGVDTPGTLTVSNGGSVSSANALVVGGPPGGSSGGTGTVTISSGGTVTTPVTVLGFTTGATGTVTVTGAGSMLNASAFLALGGDGNVGGIGKLVITSNGAVNTPLVDFESSTSSVNASGGVLNTGALTSMNAGFGSIALTNPIGGYALNINDTTVTDSNTYSGTISGTGSLNKSGGSTQTLSGNNTFTGPLLVTGGTLMLNGTNQFTTANVSGGTLSLGSSGRLASGANVTVYTGATFTPSTSITAIGTLNLSGGTLLITQPNINYSLNQIVTGTSGGTITDSSGGFTSLNLTNTGAGINVMGNSNWSSVAGGVISNGGSGDISIRISPGVTLTNGLGLVGFNGYSIIGGGTLYENADPHLYIGSSITVTQGTFRVTDASSIDSGGSAVGNLGEGFFILDGGTFSYGGATASTIKIINTTGNGGTIQIESPSTTLTIGVNSATTASLIKTGPGTLLTAPFTASNLVINNGTLALSHSGYLLSVSTLTVGSFTTLDLGTDAADISSGNLASLNLLTQQGYNGGRWNGPGITSTTAAADTKRLTAVGVIQNNQDGSPLYTAAHQFKGVTPGVSDILAKYTYYGDANLDGKVDGSDYSRIDAAYLADKANPNAATGWYNGDFNYDGVLNGSDYTLIDNVFNSQGAQLSAEMAAPTAQLPGSAGSAVPEPAALSLLLLGGMGLLGRTNNRRVRPQLTRQPD